MNFAIQFVIGRQLALNQNVTPAQATQDGLVSALVRSPIGLILPLVLAKGQARRPGRRLRPLVHAASGASPAAGATVLPAPSHDPRTTPKS